MRLGLVGAGFGLSVHAPAFLAHEGVEIVALCSKRNESAELAGKKLEIDGRTYTDFDQFLKQDDIDAVAISVPPVLQSEYARKALLAGKSVFCEKPLALSASDAFSLAELAAERGAANAVNFEFVENPLWSKARETLESGVLGKLRHVDYTWKTETYANRMKLKSWKTDENQGGGALNMFGSHMIYHLEWLLGDLQNLNGALCASAIDIPDADSLVWASLSTTEGVPVLLRLATASPFTNIHSIEIAGENGLMSLTSRGPDYIKDFSLCLRLRDEVVLDKYRDSEWSADDDQSDGRILATSQVAGRFIRSHAGGSPVRPSFADGARVAAVMDRIRSTARQSEALLFPA